MTIVRECVSTAVLATDCSWCSPQIERASADAGSEEGRLVANPGALLRAADVIRRTCAGFSPSDCNQTFQVFNGSNRHGVSAGFYPVRLVVPGSPPALRHSRLEARYPLLYAAKPNRKFSGRVMVTVQSHTSGLTVAASHVKAVSPGCR